MAAAAEALQIKTELQIGGLGEKPPEPPLIEVVPEMAQDKLVRFRAARFIGACLLNEEIEPIAVETNLTVQPIESLHDAVQEAAKGSENGRKMVETNVRTDVIERTIKAGHVIKVNLLVDEAGEIQQHGQSMESVQANSLRFASSSWQMMGRTKAEATNAFRIKENYRTGKLEEYSFVVFSRAADNMTSEQMDEVGFFTDTMSCAIQVTTAKDGVLTTESAFVAGVKKPGEQRHDAETVAAIGDKLGINLHGQTATQTINTPVLVHNSLIPNGAIDLVKMWDEPNGTFFGEDRPPEDYLQYLQKCKDRELTLQPIVDAIVEELISEAPTITNRIDAVRRLNKLSGKHMVQQAVFDHTINPQVFGPVSAGHIVEARLQFGLGNNEGGLQSISKAIKTDASRSCPGSLKDPMDPDDDPTADSNNKECEFVSKECPVCRKKNVKTTVTKTKITGDCGCSVDK